MLSFVTLIGRPSGSTDGVTPVGGFPDVNAEFGAFLAGFIEGEGSFGITRQRRGPFGCSMQLCVRDDDRPLVAEILDKTRVGRHCEKPARGRSRPQICWLVTNKASCLRLVEILDANPLRGRKSHDYALWRPAVRWWAAGDPQRRYINRDWAAMEYLKSRLSECKQYRAEPAHYPLEGASEFVQDWMWFFSGFATAEAHIGIAKNGSRRWLPRFQIALRDDDYPLLSEFRRRLGMIGKLYRGERLGSRPSVARMVRDAAGLRHLVEVLDAFPPRGRKQLEFKIWRQAVLEYEAAPRRSHERLQELRAALDAIRSYKAPGELT